MSGYSLKFTFEDGSEAIAHYGVKGMKWGQHVKAGESNATTPEGGGGGGGIEDEEEEETIADKLKDFLGETSKKAGETVDAATKGLNEAKFKAGAATAHAARRLTGKAHNSYTGDRRARRTAWGEHYETMPNGRKRSWLTVGSQSNQHVSERMKTRPSERNIRANSILGW